MIKQITAKVAATSGYITPVVSFDVLFETIWALTTLTFLLLPARLYARWKTASRLDWDDVLVTFAWITSLAITAMITIYYPNTTEIMSIGAGRNKSPSDVKVITKKSLRVFTAIPMLFYAGLWSVKLSFLIFFRKLGTHNVATPRRWWGFVLTVTILSFFVCYTTLPYRCTLTSLEIVASHECQSPGLIFVPMGVNTALDVLTDCLILSIPVLILRRIRISKYQRIGLSVVFFLVVITMIVALVRATVSTVGVKRRIDPLWMYLWTNAELNIAITVACIAPYRSLFIHSCTPQAPQQPKHITNLAHKLCCSPRSHSRLSRQQDIQRDSSVAQLSHIAPWVEFWQVEQTETEANMGCEKCNMTGFSPYQKDTYMTATMPYLAPWVDADTIERGSGSCDTQVSPPALVHLEGRETISYFTSTLEERV